MLRSWIRRFSVIRMLILPNSIFRFNPNQNQASLGLRRSRIPLQCRRRGFSPWVEESSWRRNGYPLQDSGLENPMHRKAWRATVHGVAKRWTQLSALCLQCMLSHFSHVWLCVTLWTVARQASLSMGFSRQQYWSRLPFPSPRNLPDSGIEPTSLMSPELAGKFFTTEPPGKLFRW